MGDDKANFQLFVVVKINPSGVQVGKISNLKLDTQKLIQVNYNLTYMKNISKCLR